MTPSMVTTQEDGYHADDAVNWADNLVYFDAERNVTWDNWRLPHVLPINGSSYNYTRSVVGQTDDGYNISASGTIYAGSTGSELAYMFYNNMGNLSFYDLNGNPNQPDWGNPSPGIFVNLVETNFWTGTEYAPDSNKAWLFDFQSGGQYSDGKDITKPKYRAWALMDGDVASDTDSDGTPDCNDNCPNDPNKTEPGICGCSVTDTDTDSDGTPDCIDSCLNDPNKTQPGVCGCGISDIDTDGDGTPDCNDNCPNDPNKTQSGVCGCGTSDTDSDNDGIPDCMMIVTIQ